MGNTGQQADLDRINLNRPVHFTCYFDVTEDNPNGNPMTIEGRPVLSEETTVTFRLHQPYNLDYKLIENSGEYPNAKVLDMKLSSTGDTNENWVMSIDLDGDGRADVEQSFSSTGYHEYNTDNNKNDIYPPIEEITLNFSKKEKPVDPVPGNTDEIPDSVVKIHFGSGNDSAEDYYYINKADATLDGLGLSDTTIETQDKAQKALNTIGDAIVKKDNIRAYYGAMQNRLENTITNITTQAENLQAAESRISDVDVATEMTNFVRSQILTQAAVAMLSQANSIPQILKRIKFSAFTTIVNGQIFFRWERVVSRIARKPRFMHDFRDYNVLLVLCGVRSLKVMALCLDSEENKIFGIHNNREWANFFSVVKKKCGFTPYGDKRSHHQKNWKWLFMRILMKVRF